MSGAIVWVAEPDEDGHEYVTRGHVYATACEFGGESVWTVRALEPWPSPIIAGGVGTTLGEAKSAAEVWLRANDGAAAPPPSPLRPGSSA